MCHSAPERIQTETIVVITASTQLPGVEVMSNMDSRDIKTTAEARGEFSGGLLDGAPLGSETFHLWWRREKTDIVGLGPLGLRLLLADDGTALLTIAE
ncbi:hypothetical protein chiPu_0017776 [Chiloscyllium punctatum]|uniref:Uncharacterized protein n=1 Tax=Chiloscyllium punctatum TaxID=137246 RepID=A0A401RIU9_CHIPU|nr:hypothetical protein [Chiloscyllium punctatum]